MASSLASQRLHSLVLVLLLYLTPVSADDGALSICEYAPISGLRLCASWCITFGNTEHCDKLAMFLSCGVWGGPQKAIRNECYCRPDLFSTAHSILSDCDNTACSSNSVDVAQAISVYDGYCNSVGKFDLPCLGLRSSRSGEVELTNWRLGYTAATTSSPAQTSQNSQSGSKGPSSTASGDSGLTSTITITTAPPTETAHVVTQVQVGVPGAAAPARGAIISDRWTWRDVVFGFLVFVLTGLGQLILNMY
jgi:hypothetical protein